MCESWGDEQYPVYDVFNEHAGSTEPVVTVSREQLLRWAAVSEAFDTMQREMEILFSDKE